VTNWQASLPVRDISRAGLSRTKKGPKG
jgi:hypothetical protein